MTAGKRYDWTSLRGDGIGWMSERVLGSGLILPQVGGGKGVDNERDHTWPFLVLVGTQPLRHTSCFTSMVHLSACAIYT